MKCEDQQGKFTECFMKVSTNNLKSSQRMIVVIIKKGENVEHCFDVTTSNSLSASIEDQATKQRILI